jgi:hypothetical protein
VVQVENNSGTSRCFVETHRDFEIDSEVRAAVAHYAEAIAVGRSGLAVLLIAGSAVTRSLTEEECRRYLQHPCPEGG